MRDRSYHFQTNDEFSASSCCDVWLDFISRLQLMVPLFLFYKSLFISACLALSTSVFFLCIGVESNPLWKFFN